MSVNVNKKIKSSLRAGSPTLTYHFVRCSIRLCFVQLRVKTPRINNVNKVLRNCVFRGGLISLYLNETGTCLKLKRLWWFNFNYSTILLNEFIQGVSKKP